MTEKSLVEHLTEIQKKYKRENVSQRDDKYWPNYEFEESRLQVVIADFIDFIADLPDWRIKIKKSYLQNYYIISLYKE